MQTQLSVKHTLFIYKNQEYVCVFWKQGISKKCLVHLLDSIFLYYKSNVENLEKKGKLEKEHISLHKSMIISLVKFPWDLGQLVHTY